MTKKEAVKILCDSDDSSSIWYCGDERIILFKSDIINNIECNNYELNLDFIQDFCGTEVNLFQGHSLSELEKEPY